MDGPEHGTTESQQDISVLEQNECEPERNANEPERIAVMCIGNTLMLDEGVGPRVAEELLSRFSFPEHVDVLDCGTMGMSLLSVMRRYDVILVVDAVDNTGHPPGTVLTFSPEDIASYAQPHSAHDTRFIDVLEAADLIGYRPQGYCLGVQILNMNPAQMTIGLTQPVEKAVPLLVYSVLRFLFDRGVLICDKATDLPWDGITVDL